MLATFRHLAFATLFAAAIAAPWAVNLVEGPDPAHDLEVSRPRAEKPDPTDLARWREFPERYAAWLDDSFGLRSRLLRMHNRIKVKWLGVSPADNLIVGEDGWIFATDDLVVENHRGVIPLSEADLVHWSDTLEERRDWLLAQGARYVIFMPPDKHGMYSEKLPAAMRREGAVSRYRQWLPRMCAATDVEVVDLYEPLEAARRDGRLVYFPLGTHWTIPGAFVGTRAVIERVSKWFPGMTPPSWDDFTIVTTTDHPGDSWGGKLLIEDLLSQPVVGLERHAPLPFRRDGVAAAAIAAEHGVKVTVTVHDDPSLPSAVMFHDSFVPAMMDFLSCSFSRVVYFWSPVFRPEIVLEEQPDVVIHERVERFLAYLPPRLAPKRRRELEAWRRRGSPDPGADPAGRVVPGRWFNPGVGVVEILVDGGVRLRVADAERAAAVRSRRVLEDDRGWKYVIAAGDGATLSIMRGTGVARLTAYRTAPSDATDALSRFVGDYRAADLVFGVRCLGGKLVVFANDGEEASVLLGGGPRFVAADKPGVVVEFGERGFTLQVGATGRLVAVRMEQNDDGGD